MCLDVSLKLRLSLNRIRGIISCDSGGRVSQPLKRRFVV